VLPYADSVRIEAITTRDALPVTELQAFDASFTTTTVYDVVVLSSGLELVERQLDLPLTKRYQLLQDLHDDRLPWDCLLLAREDSGITAVAATSYSSWNQRQVLDELHVAPSHRRRGLARTLVDQVRGIARGNGARELWLETQSVNLPAIHAYRRLGFSLTGIDTTFYAPPHEHEAAVFMSQPLPGQAS